MIRPGGSSSSGGTSAALAYTWQASTVISSECAPVWRMIIVQAPATVGTGSGAKMPGRTDLSAVALTTEPSAWRSSTVSVPSATASWPARRVRWAANRAGWPTTNAGCSANSSWVAVQRVNEVVGASSPPPWSS